MLQTPTLNFLNALKKNNNKQWFDNNRDKYDAAKLDFENFVSSVLEKFSEIDPSIAELKPKDCVFRINRDVRFSKNKAPYKTNMAMYIARGGKKSNAAGYYLHCEPGAAFLAGGVWMPMAPELIKIRQEIDYSFPEFKKIISAKKFIQSFGDLEKTNETSLIRAPKNYEEDNPAIEYLKLKSFIATSKMSDDVLISKVLVKEVINRFKVIKPLTDFLNRSIEE